MHSEKGNVMDDVFNYYYSAYSGSEDFFWFEIDREGRLGYRMSNSPDHFQIYSREIAEKYRHTWIIRSPRIKYGPDIPPVILKIRVMEARWKHFQQKKLYE